MDVYNILSSLGSITKQLADIEKQRATNNFDSSLGIDKEQHDAILKLINSYKDSGESIDQYQDQIKDCDKSLKEFDKEINKLTKKLGRTTDTKKRDKIQSEIDEQQSKKRDTENRRRRLKNSVDKETDARNFASQRFSRMTGGKNIASALSSASNLTKGGKLASINKMMGGLGNNPYVAAVGLLVKAVEFGIGKATDYMKLNYENLLRQLNATTAVSLNAMKASMASWQDSVSGAYEAQNMAISSQETLLETQNATELANTKMANTWTNWIPIWGQINKYQEAALELEQQVAQTRLKNAHEIISMVNDFTKKTDEYIKKQDKAVRDFQTNRGMSEAQNGVFEKWMLGQGESFAKFNRTIEDVLKMQSSFTEQSGRAVNFSENDNLQSIAVGRLMGEENVVNFQSQMQLFNHSVAESADIMYEMYKDVNKMGLSQKKVAKDVLANLKLANKYDFKNGTKGFIELAKWAENARFNLSSLGNMIEKVQSGGLEGTITQAAKLQVLGGNFARYSDPLAMMYNANADPDAYAKQVLNMFKGMGRMNSETGETDFNYADTLRIRSAAEALGMSTEDAKNMIREDNKKGVVKRQMRGSTLNAKQQDAVANRAQRDAETGQWYVQMLNGEKMDVSQVQAKDLDNIVSDNKDESAIQYAQGTMSYVEKIEAITRQIDAKLGKLSFDNFGEAVGQSNKNTLDYYTKNIDNVISAIQIDRKEAIKAQEEQLKKLATIGDKIVEALAVVKDPYEGVDMDKEQKKIDIAEAQNKYRRNIKGRIDTWDEKWNKTVAVNAMERGGDSGWNWWKNRASALWEGFTDSNKELDERAKATGYIDKNGKPIAIEDNNVVPIHDGAVSVAKPQSKESGTGQNATTSNQVISIHDGIASITQSPISKDKSSSNNGETTTIAAGTIKNIHDGTATIAKSDSKDKVVSGNGTSMAVAANKVVPIHDGAVSVAKTDPQDSAIFAKTGGPFDTLFNGVFDKINELYGIYFDRINHDNVSPNFTIEPVPIEHDKVFPTPVSIDNNSSSTMSNQGTGQATNMQKGQFDVNVRGEINLKANGQNINLIDELETNPTLVRAITNLISDSISKKINGGRAIPGGQPW